MLDFLRKLICKDCSDAEYKYDILKFEHEQLKEKFNNTGTEYARLLNAYNLLSDDNFRMMNYINGTNRPLPSRYYQLSTSTLLYALLPYAKSQSKIYFADTVYQTATYADYEMLLNYDMTNRKIYVPEKYDCDDFAFRLKGQFTVPGWSELPLFIVWTDLHAFNAFVDENGKLWLVEPQNDLIFEPSNDMHEQYKNVKIIIG